MMDANQRWDVPEAVEWMTKLAALRDHFSHTVTFLPSFRVLSLSYLSRKPRQRRTFYGAQRFLWAAKQPLGNAALGALFA